MALNIAVPLSGVGGLSPISPIGIDCWENIKLLVSPIGSESSGVSSLDSEEAKQQQQQKQPSPPPETETRNSLSPEKQLEEEEEQQQQQQLQQEQKQEELKNSAKEPPKKSLQDLKIIYNGRDILDLAKNTEINTKLWNFCYTYLPENNNIPMFLANRSQYHRLGANGHIHEYSLVKCDDCDFQYPMNSSSSFFYQTSVAYSLPTNSAMTYTGPSFYNKLVTTNSVNTINDKHHNNNNNNNNNNNHQQQMQQVSYQNHQQQQQFYNNQNNTNKNCSTNMMVENLFGVNNGFIQGKKIPSPIPLASTMTTQSHNYAAAFNKNTNTSFPFVGTNSTPSSSGKSAISTVSNGTMLSKSAPYITNITTTSGTLNNTSPSLPTITSGFTSPKLSTAAIYEKYQMMNKQQQQQQQHQQQQQQSSSMFMQNNHQQKNLNNVVVNNNYNKTASNTVFGNNLYSLLNSLNNGLGNNNNNSNNNISPINNNSNNHNNAGNFFQANSNPMNATTTTATPAAAAAVAASSGNNSNNSFAMFMNGSGQQQQNFTRMYKYF